MQDDAEQSPVDRHRRPAQGTQRDALRDAIAREELVFAKLQADQAESMHRLTALRAELAALDAEPEIHVNKALILEPRTPADKVRLFRSLFRGREEVFPTRFESRKTGKSGYAPACRNKFVRGVCELPKVKCGDCPNQAFIPRAVPMLWQMFQKRLRGYRSLGYARGEAPFGLREPVDDVVVEYDEEVLRLLDERDDFG
jgi:hypothetical protein